MRQRLALLALAITSLVVVAFTVPLMLVVRQQAGDRARLRTEREVQTVAGLVALAVSGIESLDESVVSNALGNLPDQITVVLPDGSALGEISSGGATLSAARLGQPSSGYDGEDWAVGLPVSTRHGVVAVVGVAAADQLTAGVRSAWVLLAGLGLAVIGAAVVVAMRLGRALVKPVDELAEVATRLGQGDLEARARTDGPVEVAKVAEALNGLAGRLREMIAAERESLADLSHRLRTPLTSLRLQAEGLPASEEKESVQAGVDRMQVAVDSMIREVRQGSRRHPAADLGLVVHQRGEFWKVLAAEQGRAFESSVTDSQLWVELTEEDLGSMLDGLVGNVFNHTKPGVGVKIRAERQGSLAVLTIEDDGPGFPPGLDPVKRGVSGGGSTGLGLDIARRLAERTGGSLRPGRSQSGGARVEVKMQMAEGA